MLLTASDHPFPKSPHALSVYLTISFLLKVSNDPPFRFTLAQLNRTQVRDCKATAPPFAFQLCTRKFTEPCPHTQDSHTHIFLSTYSEFVILKPSLSKPYSTVHRNRVFGFTLLTKIDLDPLGRYSHGWICIQLNLYTGVCLIELTFETVLHDFTSEPCFRSYTTSQLDLNPDREFTSIIFFLSASVFITLEVLAYSCFPLPYSLFLLSLMW